MYEMDIADYYKKLASEWNVQFVESSVKQNEQLTARVSSPDFPSAYAPHTHAADGSLGAWLTDTHY